MVLTGVLMTIFHYYENNNYMLTRIKKNLENTVKVITGKKIMHNLTNSVTILVCFQINLCLIS